jgi:Flp pilus assembly pilin Flp
MSIWTSVRADHPLRSIRSLSDAVLASLSRDFAALYSGLGRPSIAPEMRLQAFYSVRSERQLMERLEFDDSQKLVEDEGGATAIEYGLIAALIAVAGITAMNAVGSSLTATLNNVSSSSRSQTHYGAARGERRLA